MPPFANLSMNRRLFEENKDPAAGAGAGGAGAGAKPETFSREYVHELREESANYRKRAQEAEKKAQEADERAAKQDADTKRTMKEAQSAADRRIILAELKAEALKAGMVDLDFLKLADLSEVKLNEQGEIEGADKLIAKLKKDKPHFFKESSGTSSTDGKPARKASGDKKDAREMSDAEFNAEMRRLNVRV